MKGENLFPNLRDALFCQRFYLLGGDDLLVLQNLDGEPVLGDDFNDLPTSLFACNVHQCVFEEQEGKVGGEAETTV